MTAAMLLMTGSNSPLIASVSPAEAYGEYACTGYPPNVCASPQTVTTNTVTVSYTGGDGSAPTYAWALLSGTAHTVTAATSATTAFEKSVTRLQTFTAVYRCTLTVGSEVALLDVPVTTFYNYETGL